MTPVYTAMCACLYRRARSPYWWIKPKQGKPRSTKLRHAVPSETKDARDLLAKEVGKEQITCAEPERWDAWVPEFIEERYEESPKSKERYWLRWRAIRAFLIEHDIKYPRQLKFSTVTKYVTWRRKGSLPAHGVKGCGKNTAIGDVKFLSLVMKRAVQLEYAPGNPVTGLVLTKAKPKEKPEITDEHFALTVRALNAEPEWMRINFLICYYTGCRLREACVPLDCVDLANRFIHFPDTKGDKPFTVPLRDELLPLFSRLKQEGRKRAFEMPGLPSKDFWQFFKRINLPQYCVHCCRVTFITRGARAGIRKDDMMRLVNHASEEIHRIYQRFQPEDLREALNRVPLPSVGPSVATHATPESIVGC